MIRSIEFMGVPGSGKTTCASLLRTCLHKRGIPALDEQAALRLAVRRRDDGILKNMMKRFPPWLWERFLGPGYAMEELLEFMAAQAPLWATVMEAMSRRGMDAEEAKIMLRGLLKNSREYALLETLTESPLYTVEEGFAHRAFTVFGYLDEPVPHDELKRYADLIPCCDLVVRVSLEPEICAQRLETRRPIGLSDRLQRLTADQRIALLSHGVACIEIAAQRLIERGSRVVAVQTESRDMLMEQLEQIAGTCC